MNTSYFKVLLLAALVTAQFARAQAPDIEWKKSFGGSNYDNVASIQQCNDGGYIIAGTSASTNGDVTGNHDNIGDYWIVKTDASGMLQWQKCFGSLFNDLATSIQQCNDGGYIVAGSSSFNNGDVTGNHGGSDYWIIKLDASGTLQWQKSIGGSDDDIANSIQQCSDGGYIVAGSSRSSNGDVTGNHGSNDYWVVKLNALGNLQWQRSYGGSGDDNLLSIRPCSDGGYIAIGSSSSNDGNVTGHHGANTSIDCWVVKLDASGQLQWQKSLGGTEYDDGSSIEQCSDGGYILVGSSHSTDGDVTDNHGAYDYWVVKLGASGNIQWQKSIGGSNVDNAISIKQCTGGGYIVAGYSNSNDAHVTGNHGSDDYWIVKLNASGMLQWQKSLGGTSRDLCQSIQQCGDGGYIVAGSSTSNDGDISDHKGNWDYWIVKLAADSTTTGITPLTTSSELNIYPNPVKGVLTLKTMNTKPQTFTITDITGRIIKTGSVTGNISFINVTDLANGTYNLLLKDEMHNVISKFVVNNWQD